MNWPEYGSRYFSKQKNKIMVNSLFGKDTTIKIKNLNSLTKVEKCTVLYHIPIWMLFQFEIIHIKMVRIFIVFLTINIKVNFDNFKKLKIRTGSISVMGMGNILMCVRTRIRNTGYSVAFKWRQEPDLETCACMIYVSVRNYL